MAVPPLLVSMSKCIVVRRLLYWKAWMDWHTQLCRHHFVESPRYDERSSIPIRIELNRLQCRVGNYGSATKWLRICPWNGKMWEVNLWLGRTGEISIRPHQLKPSACMSLHQVSSLVSAILNSSRLSITLANITTYSNHKCNEVTLNHWRRNLLQLP